MTREAAPSSETLWTDAMPEAYDRLLGPVLFEPYAELLAGRVTRAGRRPRAILEVAAGTGLVTRELLSRIHPTARVTATDLNPAMVDRGRHRAGAARWRTADVAALPFPGARFDLVVCAFGMMFVPDRVAAYREMRRVVVPDGRLALTIWDRLERNELPAAFARALARVLPDDTPDFLTRVPHGYADPDRIRAELTAAGWEQPDVAAEVLEGTALSTRALARGFCRATPLRFALERRGDLEELTERIADAMTAELGAGPVHGAFAAFLVEATTR